MCDSYIVLLSRHIITSVARGQSCGAGPKVQITRTSTQLELNKTGFVEIHSYSYSIIP